jgi:hypothetical protein
MVTAHTRHAIKARKKSSALLINATNIIHYYLGGPSVLAVVVIGRNPLKLSC